MKSPRPIELPPLQAVPVPRGERAKGITLVVAQILPVVAIVSLFPAIPRLFEHFAGLKHIELLVPMILTVPSLVIAISAPFAGAIADRFGRRRSFIFGMGLYVVAGMVPIITANLLLIVLSRMALGLAESFVVTISSALMADYFGERRYRWVAWVGIVIAPAGTLMIIAGGVLADLDWRGPFYIYVLAVPAFLLSWFFIDEPLNRGREAWASKPRLPFPWRQAGVIGSLTLLASLIYYVEPLNISRILEAAGVKSATLTGLIQAATTPGYVIGALLYRWTSRRSIAIHMASSWALIGIGEIIIGQSQMPFAIATGAFLQQIGAGFTIPSLLAWGQALLPLEQRGRGMGIWTTAFFTGTFLSPPLMTGLAAVASGLPEAIFVMGVASLALAVVAWMLVRLGLAAAAATATGS